MKIDLALENWVDLFGSVPREQLVELLPQIDDRQFANVLQFFLHKCGQITIGSLAIGKDEEGLMIARKYPSKLPLADVPMPSNITNFHRISISNFDFDSPTVDFLQEFQLNSLLVNVNLDFHHCTADDVLAFLTKFLPMITSINSVTALGQTRTYNLLGLLENKFPSLSKRMLTSVRILNTWRSLNIDWICRWLYTPRDDGKPRVLYHFYAPNSDNSLVNRLKKDFMEAIEPISFFLRSPMGTEVQALTLENVQTQETFVISFYDDGIRNVLISRYPTGVSEEWLNEMSQFEHWECRNIYMYGNDHRYKWSSCSSGFCCDSLGDEINASRMKMKKSRRNKGMKKEMAKKGKKSRKKRKQSRMKKTK